jgi:hypothetical protein
MEIPTLNTRLKIKEYSSPKMILEDGSLFDFSPLPPSGWFSGDTVTVADRGSVNTRIKRPSAYTVTNISRDQKFDGTCLKGADNQSPSADVNKSMTDTVYPENHLEKSWGIRKAKSSLIVLDDDSIWSLSAPLVHQNNSDQMNDWHKGQSACVSRTVGKGRDIRTYSVTNEETGVVLIGEFAGWER